MEKYKTIIDNNIILVHILNNEENFLIERRL